MTSHRENFLLEQPDSSGKDFEYQTADFGAPILSLDQLPIFDKTTEGEVAGGITVDYWCYLGEKLVLSGWILGERFVDAATAEKPSASVSVSSFQRPDVELAFSSLQNLCLGILAVVSPEASDSFELCGHKFRIPRREENPLDRSRLWQDHRSRAGFLLRHCPTAARDLAGLADQLEAVPATAPRARGYLEQAKGVLGCGGLVVGWAVALPGAKVGLMDALGHLVILDRAVRWHRTDIVEAYGNEFGNFTFNAGFLQAWHHPLQFNESLHLVVLDGDACYILASIQWKAAPIEPTSFARWAFDFPTPLDSFYERLDHHDGRIIEALISAKLISRLPAQLENIYLGTPVANPLCSVIVPLYGRADFMMNQLLEMSDDHQFKTSAELVYVVDDPRILSQVKQQAWLLYEANQVPFQIISAGENRGFSGANNLGVAASRAPYILLLNSDVIPVEPGWIGKMMAAFDAGPHVGIVGTRLFYPNGSLQHDGMIFVWEPGWNAYLNKHPRSGMEPIDSSADTPSREIAVTAACLMLRRSTFEQIDGLDEGYLIGDFEDSDLCMKVRELNLDVVMIKDVNLVHLERQSFADIGHDRFREQVARFNAWRHQHRWGQRIAQLLKDFRKGNGDQ